MKLEKFDYMVWGTICTVIVAIVFVILIGDQVGARIVGVTPEDGGTVGVRARIGIEFAQAMIADSVESSFQIDPPVQGKFKWERDRVWFIPNEALKVGARYTATLRAGAKSQSGQQVKRDASWNFVVREPQIAYVFPANDDRELWRTTMDGGAVKKLTKTGGRVYDFAVSPDGEKILYSVVNDKRGADLWTMTRDGEAQKILINCDADRCTIAAWSPDGSRIAYSREPAGIAPNTPNGPPRVWTADAASGQTAPLFKDSQVLGYNPLWSPDGKWLAFFDGQNGTIHAVNVQTTDEILLKSTMGLPGAWSPDSNKLIFTDFTMAGDQPSITVYVADFNTNQVNVILGSDSPYTDYGVPAWSPSGEWWALGLRTVDGGASKQVWLMKPDGSSPRAVTATPTFTHGAYQWDASGRILLFQRFELGVPFAKPEILIWSLEGGEPRVLIKDGSLPAWLP